MAGSFSKDVRKWVNKTEERMEFVQRRTALEILMRLIQRTPVLTGRARGNWLVGVDRPPEGTVEYLDKDGSGGFAMQKLMGVVKGRVIWIVNNLPYIWKLEYGSSDQAPQGMVRVTLAEFHRIVENAIRVAKTRFR